MPTKLEYLKKVINTPIIENKNWYINCFSIPILKDDLEWENKNLWEIVTKPDGLYFIDINEEQQKVLNKISDYKKDTPLFAFQDVIEIDPSWGPFVKSKIQTKIGVLIVNVLILFYSFKGKLEYINEQIKIPNIEAILAQRVVNDKDASETDITVSEMITCMDRFSFLTNFSNIINIPATVKTITPPPGIEKIKKDLMKEYEGQLHDSVKLVELEKRLTDVDNEYMKDDPSAKVVFTKKGKLARKKMFLVFGDTQDFNHTTSARAVIPSLTEGLSTEEEDFPKYMNDLRIGSFARGASTQLGGYTYKILQRSLSNLSISPAPCDTKRGLKRLITSLNINNLTNRYILESGKWILIKDKAQAEKYLNKVVEMRSTMYCTAPKNTVCYACVNDTYKAIPTGVTNIASDLSAVLLSLFMQLTHGIAIESTTLELNDLVT